ncbi:MAG: FecR domain-containing protein [Candidatus Riflebacteria bacterium]|nr:FecR domain-containing protein [Candidatus Riflebacteria bacterium]
MKLSKLLPGSLLAAGLIFTFPASSLAVDLTATEITSIEGRVEVRKGAEAAFKKLHSNLKLSGALKRLDGGDKVRTHIESSAEMALKDTCILAVKEQSIFEVPRTLGKNAIAELKAQQGALLFKVISGSNFQVQTADVIAGVKGTLFEVDIIDNFECLLETPGLQIGTLAPGGTVVNVYKGEVELTHAQTGKKRTLKEGESLAALGSSLLKFDSILQEGFTPLRNFDPASLLGEKYGQGALGLLDTNPTLSGLTEFAGLGNVPVNLGDNRFSEMLTGLDNPLIEKLQAVEEYTRSAGEIIDSAKELEQLGKDLMGEEFKFDFSEFNREEQPFTVSERNFREIYLGNNSFAACKAAGGSRSARLEPTSEGLLLNEGNSVFKFKKFKNVTPAIEFAAGYQQNGTDLITSINLVKGDLYGRIPGDIKFFKIPRGLKSYHFNTATGQGQWLQTAAGAIPDDLNRHIMKIDEKIAREKGQHDQETKTKQVDAVKKVIKNPRDLLRKFKF